ncbi:hypothetical protein BOTBODRAFT_174497 [Botryobasidium botryosum FD-172 SS1]|uniref:F-box domain-containing protein n=1 Tax=Botryobasidium botryosum (strain FD-172 SS1) TaxID=930990 RepID=A0A067MIR6_BOTB1|nr:hypothetical protein BOTBODRAFT_174497 [Botryobasidium botryosum FD-172 SS1]
MLLLELDYYDVLREIVLFVQGSRSLLALALTCRTLRRRDIIIPDVLFARVTLSRRSSRAQVASFEASIEAEGSTAGNAVLYFKNSCGTWGSRWIGLGWSHALQRMPNLRSLDVRLPYMESTPHFFRQLVIGATNLQSLTLANYEPACDDSPLGDLGGLRRLSIDFLGGPGHSEYFLTRDSALGRALLNFRDTLKELSLDSIRWNLDANDPLPHASSRLVLGGRPFMWPHVTKLHLKNVSIASVKNQIAMEHSVG